MHLRVAVENNLEGRSTIWALEHPGCFVYGANQHQALHALPAALDEYAAWISRYDSKPWFELGPHTYHIEETWHTYQVDEHFELVEKGGYEVESWFLHDWKPLTDLDVERGLKMLGWSRLELLLAAEHLSPQTLDRAYKGERWSIRGILKHVAGAEWWYLDRLGMAPPREQLPEDVFEQLEFVRRLLNQALPELVGANKVVGIAAEFWSPRKLLRRALWHERDHHTHIRKLLAKR